MLQFIWVLFCCCCVLNRNDIIIIYQLKTWSILQNFENVNIKEMNNKKGWVFSNMKTRMKEKWKKESWKTTPFERIPRAEQGPYYGWNWPIALNINRNKFNFTVLMVNVNAEKTANKIIHIKCHHFTMTQLISYSCYPVVFASKHS